MYALSAPVICGYITGNAFARDSTVMPHVLSVCLSVCPPHSAIVSKQCRLDHETFTYKLHKRLVSESVKLFSEIRTGSS